MHALRYIYGASLAAALAIGLAIPAQAGTVPGGGHQAPPHAPRPTVGERWGANVDAQITQALRVDDGNGTSYSDASLGWGIAQRSAAGWADPAALHYLNTALTQSNPYGLNYAWDAFGDGTVNPATTIYTITLAQLGWPALDAYRHGHGSLATVTAIVDKMLATPRIAVSPGIGLSYSNNKNDVKPGYVVHNINQAVAIWLQDVLDAGITYKSAQTQPLIDGLNVYELASYQPAINGWAYRNGGVQTIQDAGHNGVGAMWGQRFHEAAIGDPVVHSIETTDYGWELGSGVHASLGQWDCVDSGFWLGQYSQYMAAFTDFGSTAKSTPMMAQTASACGGRAPVNHFTVKSKAAMKATKTHQRHVAPDAP